MAKDSWLTVNPMAGEGNATLTNSGTIHKGRLERQTVVTAVVKGIEAAKSYQVKQEPTAEYITLDKTSFDVGGRCFDDNCFWKEQLTEDNLFPWDRE